MVGSEDYASRAFQRLLYSLGLAIDLKTMQRYNKKKRPAKLGLIYAEDCSKLQSIAEKVQKKLQQIAADCSVICCVPGRTAGT